MSAGFRGRVPDSAIRDGEGSGPAPEDIPETTEPSEAVWEHEQELYHRKPEER